MAAQPTCTQRYRKQHKKRPHTRLHETNNWAHTGQLTAKLFLSYSKLFDLVHWTNYMQYRKVRMLRWYAAKTNKDQPQVPIVVSARLCMEFDLNLKFCNVYYFQIENSAWASFWCKMSRRSRTALSTADMFISLQSEWFDIYPLM